ncbi:MAG: methylmalonyl-CoA mutase [Dehalococcoidia bacterium]|jgi:methylmalonyl-CoA mutase C-terminal domain/subunit|nr:MAG: methylmalonyl-CoA mutase [Dehalococcoidia bacterium]
MTRPANVKVLLAKLGLDGHDRGLKVIARAMRDAGFEVVYMGMRVTADQVAQTALQEDVDVVGISILSGAHMRLIPRLTDSLKARQISDDILLLVGGTIPEDDVEDLHNLGVQGVFPVGSFTSTMTKFIIDNISRGRSSPKA